MRRDPVERFWSWVEKTETCWLWKGALNHGYGSFSIGARQRKAHRFSYELAHGAVPEGLTLDHLCRNRPCVRPDHLEAVTDRENILRGESFAASNSRKTHCKRGHPFTSENTYRDRKNRRVCRACHYEFNLAWEREHLGRTSRRKAEQHPQAKLTWDDVRAIRASSDTSVSLARRYEVHPSTIRRIRLGQKWRSQEDRNAA